MSQTTEASTWSMTSGDGSMIPRAATSLRALLHWGTSILFLPIFFCAALVTRVTTSARPQRARPRVLWGMTPIINIKYWSQSLIRLGFDSRTVVRGFFSINERRDFDICDTDFLWSRGPRFLIPLKDYVLLLWALPRTDIFVFFFDGGFLALSPLQRIECRLLHLAGKRVVVTPYGSDIAAVGYLGPFEQPTLREYPWTADRSEAVKTRVRRMATDADLVIKNLQVGFLPRYDVIWPSQLAVDTTLWRPRARGKVTGGDEEVVVVHAANHRQIKGTAHVIEAVATLRSEGLPIRLVVLEHVSNNEVREAVLAADVVVEQLIGGYGLFAVEAMSSGKPVLSNLRWMDPNLRAHPIIQNCPIVDCDAADLEENLRDLVRSPEERAARSRASRDYAVRYHSYEAIGQAWAELLQWVWNPEQRRPDTSNLPWQFAR